MAMNSIEDLINLDDEELARLDLSSLESGSADDDESAEEGTLESESEEEQETHEEEEETAEEEPETTDEEEFESEEEESDSGDSEEETEEELGDEKDKTTSFESHEAELIEKILKNPIRANNQDIQVKDADEAVRLIQMGFGMQEKARKLKPHMKHLKTLEKANLLDEDKINYSIDLLSGNKDAILKLLKDNDIDPLDLENDNPNSYVPTNHSVSDVHVQFEENLELIKTSQKSQDTINYINQLDDASFDMVKKDPSSIVVINQLMENGHHDKIMAAKDKAELLRDPLISGKSDLEAYLLIGAKLDREGAFNTDPAQSTNKETNKSTSVPNNRRKADIKSKKAANPRSGSNVGKKPQNVDLDIEDFDKLSDEEFLKRIEGW